MDSGLDIQGIMGYLPHRYPFLLVDRVLSYTPGQEIRALKNVTINEPFFSGHFPGMPIMPGVLVIEALAQTGGLLAFLSCPDRKPGTVIYFSGMDNVRFRRPVTPGDQLILELSMARRRSTAIMMDARALVEGVLAAEARLMAVWSKT